MDPQQQLLTLFGQPGRAAQLFEEVAAVLTVLAQALRAIAVQQGGDGHSPYGMGDFVRGCVVGPNNEIKQVFHSGAPAS
jgi:hypothetical protein